MVKNEIGKFKSMGEITKIFFNSLGINKETLKRIRRESEIDLEEIEVRIEEYFKELEGSTQIINYDKDKKIYKLNKETVKYLKRIFTEFKEKYIELVKEVIVGVEQEKLNEEIVKKFFCPLLNKIILNIYYCNRDSFYIKDIEDTNYYEQIKANILEILGKENFAFLIKDDGYSISNTDYMKLKNLGKNFHSNENLNELVEVISKLDDRIEKEKLEFSLFFARFYINFKNEINGKNSDINIERINILNQTQEEQELSQLFEDISINKKNDIEIISLLDLDSYLINNQNKNFLAKYEAINQNDIKLKYYLFYLYGKYLIKENRLEEALKYFELSLEQGEYRAGKFLEQIIKNGLEISSKLEKRREFKNFLKKSYFYNIIPSPYKKEGGWMFEHFKNNSNYTDYSEEEIEINLNKPNFKIEKWGRKRSQLEILATVPSFGNKIKEEYYQSTMRELIKRGADVNFRNSTGETALIRALCAKNYERALILLEDKSINKSINQESLRKRNTALSVLLENLDLNKKEIIKKILRKLIENQVDVNQKCTVDLVSPIYHILGLYFTKLNNHPLSNLVSKEQIEELRRVINLRRKSVLTNEEIYKILSYINPEIINCAYGEKTKEEKKFYLELLEILLDNGADINLTHDNLKGFTPFLYSIEIGDLDVFELFSKYNPDLGKRTHSLNGAMELAIGYNHPKLVKKLYEKFCQI